ncbi:MAG: type II toxin-antitoxin system ParD family antitoxin [Novosphingobium sp.]|nr:type II toxin-antitoxin system ParD family antitoxin [Novosphingobium sp.]
MIAKPVIPRVKAREDLRPALSQQSGREGLVAVHPKHAMREERGQVMDLDAPHVTGTLINFTLSTVDKSLLSDRIGGQTMISADLGKQLENFITSLVATGRYNSKSEVLREGVRLIQDRETRLAALDASIARGLADADAGRTTPADQVFDRLAAKYRAMSAGDE